VNCRGVQLKLSAYLDGELTGMEMLQLRSHLHDCRCCAAEVDEVRRLKSILNSLPEEEPDLEFQARLKDKVFSAQKQPAITTRASLTLISGFAFATALSMGLLFLQRQHQPTQFDSSRVAQATSQPNYDLERDQAYQAGGDPFNDGSMVLTASARTNGPPR